MTNPTVSKVPGVPHVIDVPIVQLLRSSPDRAVPIVPVVPSLRSVQNVADHGRSMFNHSMVRLSQKPHGRLHLLAFRSEPVEESPLAG